MTNPISPVRPPLTRPAHEPVAFKFRLYVADHSENSGEAIANLNALCHEFFRGCAIEVVDVFKEPERALADEVSMTPTLLKVEPAPVTRIVGTLGDTAAVLEALGFAPGSS